MATKAELETQVAKLEESNGTFLSRLKRSKLWMSIGGVAVSAVCTWLGLPLEQTFAIITPILGYVVGQGFVDGMKAVALKKNNG